MKIIMEAIKGGRPSPTDIVPGTVLRHFIYKSRAHVQFVMSSYESEFTSLTRHRRLVLSIFPPTLIQKKTDLRKD
jgi:hypothetical protein